MAPAGHPLQRLLECSEVHLNIRELEIARAVGRQRFRAVLSVGSLHRKTPDVRGLAVRVDDEDSPGPTVVAVAERMAQLAAGVEVGAAPGIGVALRIVEG